MSIIAAALRCRIIQRYFLSIIQYRHTSHPAPYGIVASVRFASTETKSGLLSRLKNIFVRSSDDKFPPNKKIANESKNSSDQKNKRKSLSWLREVAVGAEQPTDRVQTIHPNIQPPKRVVIENSLSKDQASKLVRYPESVDVKSSSLIVSEEISNSPATMKQIRQKAINNEVEAQRVYEMKNYAYIAPEDSKNSQELLIKRSTKN
ncbi:uncharacterized protein [Venturia canescens]|uniref:uncharacterized protein n=1 Tax=Venturia canescens TaxID=32260 RepID=UPI001C9BFB93|nr:uncharacterized protein LOC122412349 [Venturia canescens]